MALLFENMIASIVWPIRLRGTEMVEVSLFFSQLLSLIEGRNDEPPESNREYDCRAKRDEFSEFC